MNNLELLLSEYCEGASLEEVVFEKNRKCLSIFFKGKSESVPDALKEQLKIELQEVEINLYALTGDLCSDVCQWLHYFSKGLLTLKKEQFLLKDGALYTKELIEDDLIQETLLKLKELKGIYCENEEEEAEEEPVEAEEEIKENDPNQEISEDHFQMLIEQERENLLSQIQAVDRKEDAATSKETKVKQFWKKAELVSLSEALTSHHGDRVKVEAELVAKETKEIKDGRKILNATLYDSTGTMGLKFISKSDDHDKLDDLLKVGNFYQVEGQVQYDSFNDEVIISGRKVTPLEKESPKDLAPEKRIELSLKTKMTEVDGVCDIKEYIKHAKALGHEVLGITDKNSTHTYPSAYDAAKANDIKLIFGIELSTYDDEEEVIDPTITEPFNGEYVVFDIETTGFNPNHEDIIELGAVKIKNYQVLDRFQTFVRPNREVPAHITELTGIRDEDVRDARTIQEVLPEFLDYIGEDVLVAHNATFDMGFIREKAKSLGRTLENQYVDTLALARIFINDMKRFRLDQVARKLKIPQLEHHRAMDDAFVCSRIFTELLQRAELEKITTFKMISDAVPENYHQQFSWKRGVTLYAKEQAGIKSIYELLSAASVDYLYGSPAIPLRKILEKREYLLIGNGDYDGILFDQIMRGYDDETLLKTASNYDFLELQPISQLKPLARDHVVQSEEALEEHMRKVIELGEKLDIPVIATGKVSYIKPEQSLYRNIVRAGQKPPRKQEFGELYYRDTADMLGEFSFLGPEKARELVILNPKELIKDIPDLKPFPDGRFPPVIEGSDQELRNTCYTRAKKRYGDPLPKLIQDRLEYELKSIIGNGFAVLYIIAEKIVQKSLENGYLVGSRGSVGSSFAANMGGITEVNPLPPHYYCPDCQVVEFVDATTIGNGHDLPDKMCPKCSKPFKKDGFNIPFESFMGFEGNKEPDIDLNFAPLMQGFIHKYTEELFGKGKVFKAGTVGTIADKTAYGYVKKYYDERDQEISNREADRISKNIAGMRRSTGQHPGGIIVVPDSNDITDFTPIQYPANDPSSGVITTHYDYHSGLEGRLLKLDILGHDVPAIIRDLQDMTGVELDEIKFDDAEVLKLFNSTESLKIKDDSFPETKGTLGIPEFGTNFVRQMLDDTNPQNLEDLIRISGLSHGTNVWLNNAQELVRKGTHTIKDVIATREQIMIYGIEKGLERDFAFQFMEKVRKGKPLLESDIQTLVDANVPEWYIQCCQKISYMFPKAHAVAYVMMSFRIAYFKVYYPLAFYAATLSTRIDNLSAEDFVYGKAHLEQVMNRINQPDAKKKEQDIFSCYEIIREMYARGYEFHKVSLLESDAKRFLVKDGKLLPPIQSLEGVGETLALAIQAEREKGEFISKEDFRNRTKANNSSMQVLEAHGCFGDMQETNQLDLFGLF